MCISTFLPKVLLPIRFVLHKLLLYRFRRSVAASRNAPSKDVFGIDALLRLKRDCSYEFFHGSRFPGQGKEGEKCFVFKMSTVGPASGVDLVNRMRRDGDGDLRRAWVQFDHTRRVADWVTMACHVYDPRFVFLKS